MYTVHGLQKKYLKSHIRNICTLLWRQGYNVAPNVYRHFTKRLVMVFVNLCFFILLSLPLAWSRNSGILLSPWQLLTDIIMLFLILLTVLGDIMCQSAIANLPWRLKQYFPCKIIILNQLPPFFICLCMLNVFRISFPFLDHMATF